MDDNCLRNPIRAGYWGLPHHRLWSCILGFSDYVVGATYIHIFELYAIHRGFHWLGSWTNKCYTNSLHCVNIVKESTPKYHKYVTLILDIKNVLNVDRLVSIAHILHKSGSYVDFLAKCKTSSHGWHLSSSKFIMYIYKFAKTSLHVFKLIK